MRRALCADLKPQKHRISALTVYIMGQKEGNKQVLLREGISRLRKIPVPRVELGETEILPRVWTEHR